MVKNVERKEMYLKLYYFLKKLLDTMYNVHIIICTYYIYYMYIVHIINPRKFTWRNLPMSTSTSMSLSVSVSMDTDRDRDMNVDVDMRRWTRPETWTWTWTWVDGHGQGHGRGRGHGQIQIGNEKHEQFAVIILHVDLFPETFCRGRFV
jgi:hypothetical protein